MTKNKEKICQNCNNGFTCYNSGCWCDELPMIMPLDPMRDCLCPICLKAEVTLKVQENMSNLTLEKKEKIKALGISKAPIEGIDYYINENKLFVFTAWYHLRRGSCCGNNCKHCPYRNDEVKQS